MPSCINCFEWGNLTPLMRANLIGPKVLSNDGYTESWKTIRPIPVHCILIICKKRNPSSKEIHTKNANKENMRFDHGVQTIESMSPIVEQ